MPTIQRKPIIQAKPKLNPKIQVPSPQNPTTSSTSSNQTSNSAPSPNIVVSSSSSPPQPFPSESGPIVPPTSAVISSPRQTSVSEELSDHKPAYNNQRSLRGSFEKGKKPIKGVKRQAPLSYEDEYDPTRPNDYEEFKEFEKRRRENEVYRLHEEKARSRSMSVDSDKHSPPRSFPPPPLLYSESPPSSKASETSADAPAVRSPVVKLDLDISGEEAFLRRARLSNRINETVPKSPEPKATSIPSSGEDFAHRMLAKYGWQEGQGLGKNEQGISEPLTVQKTVKGSGYIVNTLNNPIVKPDVKPISKPETVPKVVPNYEVPSRVIMLTNMVGPGEVDDTLQEETADECNQKYGTVERCLIFEVPHGKLPDDQAVRIFVKFADQVSALKAKKDLNGRFFGGRAVTARFFDETRFEKLDLAPSAAELQMVR